MFDDFLRQHASTAGEPFIAFDAGRDYELYVDGKARFDGTQSFLASRGITVPDGTPQDGPDAETIYGLGDRKNALVQTLIEQQGVDVFAGSVQYLQAVQLAGLRSAVVSSSANTEQVLIATGLTGFFDARIDAQFAVAHQLKGKPAPDTFLAGAQALHASAQEAVVFEDALAGVGAGRAGQFGFVVGVDRVGHAAALKTHGADIVVEDLIQLLASS